MVVVSAHKKYRAEALYDEAGHSSGMFEPRSAASRQEPITVSTVTQRSLNDWDLFC